MVKPNNNGYQFLLDEIDEIKTSTVRTEEYMNQLLKMVMYEELKM